MASKLDQIEFRCSGCQEELDLASKTLPCLHSLCRSCLDKHFEGQSNGQCPDCQVAVTHDQLNLSPSLIKSLRRQQLESADFKCNLCLEEGIKSIARNWCHDCRELFCANCSRHHKKLGKRFIWQHDMRDLDGMNRDEVIDTMITDLCPLHQKEKDAYCVQCNVCFCDTCYQSHSSESPECLSPALSVREEALKQKTQAPTLAKKMNDLERSFKRLTEKTRTYIVDLNSDCDSKCQQLWFDYEEMMENCKHKTNELCAELRQTTNKQLKKWRHLLAENERILNQLETWRVNLRHFMSESQKDQDVVCGLRSLGLKLSSCLYKLVELEEKCQLGITFPSWWLQVFEHLKNENIGSVSLTVEKLPSQNLVSDRQWDVCGSNLWINSIHVSKEDNHVFVCDITSIIEFTELGDLVCKCVLLDGKTKLYPTDMCSISADILVAVCGWGVYENKLIFLKRRENPPYLQINRVVTTDRHFYSLCRMDETIFACSFDFQIDSFTKEGDKIKTIKTGGPWCKDWPLFLVDPLTGNFWGTRENYSEIYCFDQNGVKLQSVEIGEKITDFYVDDFGRIYYCNWDGIFSLSPQKISFRFEKKSENNPTIFVLRKEIYVSLSIDGKHLIKILKIID